jgi:hypothetical protein
MPLGGGGERLSAAIDDLHRPPRFEGKQGRDTFAGYVGLGAERAAYDGGQDSHLLQRQAHGLCHLPLVQMRMLRSRSHHQTSFVIAIDQRGLRLQVRVLDKRRAVRFVDHQVCLGQRRFHIAPVRLLFRQQVSAVVDKDGAFAQGLGGIQDCWERPVTHAYQREGLRRRLRRRSGNRGYCIADLANPTVR